MGTLRCDISHGSRVGDGDSPRSIRVELRLFASVAEAIGVRCRTVNLPLGATVRDVFTLLVQEQPRLERLVDRISFARNHEFVPDDSQLSDGDEVAIIPPVSGGT